MNPHDTPNTNPDQVIECWLPVVDYDSLYEVSNLGSVRSLDRVDSAGRLRKGRVLRPPLNNGYPFVNLSKNATNCFRRVHEIVATAFLGERPIGYTVNHMDGVKTNNSAENLEYLTIADNLRHARRSGLMGKLNMSQIQQVRSAYSADPHLPYSVFAKKFGVRVVVIRNIAQAKTQVSVPNLDGSAAIPIPLPIRSRLLSKAIYDSHEAGQSLNSLARQHGINVSTVSRMYHRERARLID